MNRLTTIIAIASLGVSGAAQAQDAAKAFQCELPYRDTMMALGTIEATGQTKVPGFPGLSGGGERITFAPDATLVYGQKPENLTVEILQPHPLQTRQKYSVTLTATVARSAAADAAIQQSVPWHITCGALEFCIRSSEAAPTGAGRLEYTRKEQLALKCIFEFTPEEFEAIGE